MSTGWQRLRWSLYAPFYDGLVRFHGARRRGIEGLSLKKGDRVLVVGAGTGLDLAHFPSGVEVVAGDIAPGMLTRLRRTADRLDSGIQVEEMDAQALRFDDGTFDAVLLHLILAVVPDPHRALREVARVLRPGGRVSVLDKFAPDGQEISLLRRALNPVVALLATSVDRRLGDLLEDQPFHIEHREPAALEGVFELARLRRD